MRKQYSKKEEQFITKHYSEKNSAWIAEQLGVSVRSIYGVATRLGLKKSEAFFNSEKSGRISKSNLKGEGGRFKKGQIPWNKGIHTPSTPGMKRTQFKKGMQPHNAKYDGYERVDKDGYVLVRIAPKKVKHKHRIVWEEHNGPIPPGMIITFKDGNKQNFDINNLKMISRVENMERNTIMNYEPELRPIIKTIAKLKSKINEKQN